MGLTIIIRHYCESR